MSFFDSEIVRSEMTEISELQDEVYGKFMHFPYMSNEDKLVQVSNLEKLIEKQKILYARLSLSDDPEAKMMLERITDSAQMMGISKDIDMNVVFDNMSEMLKIMKQQIDNGNS
tara:strand:+ start:292 stop:630 length:339 start_codon:yes stop_codon:yes gene_type:complete